MKTKVTHSIISLPTVVSHILRKGRGFKGFTNNVFLPPLPENFDLVFTLNKQMSCLCNFYCREVTESNIFHTNIDGRQAHCSLKVFELQQTEVFFITIRKLYSCDFLSLPPLTDTIRYTIK